MYLAMNRFKIVVGKEDEFEAVWKSRETHLDGIKGFKKFNLIKGITDKNFLFMFLIVSGVQKKIFGIGKNLNHLDWLMKVLPPIKIYT